MARVTPKERQQARLQDADTANVVRIGMGTARRIGLAMQVDVIRAFRAGRDPLAALSAQFAEMAILLTNGGVVSHLRGMSREISSLSQGIRAATKNPYSRSIRFLKDRLDLTDAGLAELSTVHNAYALQVLEATQVAVEKQVQKALVTIQTEGLHVRQGVQQLGKAFADAGIAPRNSFTLEAIFRTQTQLAYSAGKWEIDQDPAIQEILWGYKYVTVGDARVRPEHRGLEGMTAPKDDPIWKTMFPPNGFACRCQVISIFEERRVVYPPATIQVDGREFTPGADAGFRFNPGTVLRGRSSGVVVEDLVPAGSPILN